MTIKETEKLTGLTAKSIRYYESKGLIAVKRNEENSYRSYSDKDVTRLKQIKLFRYLDFSIDEIRELLNMEEEEVKAALCKKAEDFTDRKLVCEEKQDICLTLARDYAKEPEIIKEYDEVITFMESDEMAELKEDLKNLECPNLPGTIAGTMICLGPILWLFLNIYEKRTGMLMANAALALAGAVIITASWINYGRQYRRNKKRIKRNNRESGKAAFLMLACYILGCVALFAIISVPGKHMVPSHNYLFSELHLSNYSVVFMLLLIVPALVIYSMVTLKCSRKSVEELEKKNEVVYIWNRLGKWRFLIVGLWGILLYCFLTCKTCVTEDSIVCYSPLEPAGREYGYEDVEGVKTGFGNKTFALATYNRKGSFFYRIELDGQTITFHQPDTNEAIERYNEDTYLELEEFDWALMKLGIPKESDEAGYENCDFDKRYVDRFLRIVKNGK